MRKLKIEYYLNKDTPIKEIYDDKLVNNKDILDIDAKIRKISRETGSPESDVFTYVYNWYKINDDWYFFKCFDDFVQGFLNTFLGELISLYFGLQSAHYEPAKIIFQNHNYSIGVISKNFCQPNLTYKLNFDCHTYSVGDLDNLYHLQKYFDNKDTEELFKDLKALFVRDYFTGEADRGGDIIFEEHNNSIRLAPLYDYEYSFTDMASYLEYKNHLAKLNINNPKTLDFLRNDADFQKLFIKLLEIDLQEMLNEVRDNYKIIIPKSFSEIVLTREEKVKKIIREKGIVK